MIRTLLLANDNFVWKITPKTRALITKINKFWDAVNDLPGFNASLYLEDLSGDQDLLDAETIAGIIENQTEEKASILLEHELGAETIEDFVNRGLLEKWESYGSV